MPKKRELTPSERATIYNMRLAGSSYNEIAGKYSVTADCVRKVFKRLSERGFAESASRTGRKRATDDRTDRQISKKVKVNPKITAREIKEDLKLLVCLSAIKNRLNKCEFYGRSGRKKPLLSKKNIKIRLEFAKKYVNKPTEFWNTVLWTDESKFEIGPEVMKKLIDSMPNRLRAVIAAKGGNTKY